MGSEYFFYRKFLKSRILKKNIHQSKIEIQGKLNKKNPTKNEKEIERDREREITFLYGKNMHKMGETSKFIVRLWE